MARHPDDGGAAPPAAVGRADPARRLPPHRPQRGRVSPPWSRSAADRSAPPRWPARLDVSSAAATGIVDRLSRRGHLERVPDADDRRRTQLHLTDTANAEVQRHLGPMFAGLARLDASFSDEERAVVERYLSGVLDCLDEVIAEP
ncbi:MarR family transcriptional regulator [Nocardioides sp. W3-2-3]|nr:MarR family transcriptional regulator [Nocardioides convexus]